ncbi:uncharacterized protein BDV17DRAFT_276042 [Aspergillus undulatus]|uniref:uncharacterized protein n=1 Tax=Aspergillus undulatus TaxID=1810928 RepID=UPI003CCDD439
MAPTAFCEALFVLKSRNQGHIGWLDMMWGEMLAFFSRYYDAEVKKALESRFRPAWEASLGRGVEGQHLSVPVKELRERLISDGTITDFLPPHDLRRRA